MASFTEREEIVGTRSYLERDRRYVTDAAAPRRPPPSE
jgi:hypothetical protein